MKATVLLVLLATAAGVPTARACRYCQQAADPVEVMRFQGQGRNAGSFPPDDSLNSFANGAPATPATAAAPVVTRAADLPPTPPAATATVPISRPTASTTRLPAAAVTTLPPVPPSVAPTAAAAVVSATPARSMRWADFGLLGLLGAGGFFAWRTRGTTRPAATA